MLFKFHAKNNNNNNILLLLCSHRPTTADVVRKKLRSCLPVRREWREIHVRGLLQLHQRVLRYRPVQRCRVRYCPQLGGSGALPAACARAPAGLSSRRDDAVLSSIKKFFLKWNTSVTDWFTMKIFYWDINKPYFIRCLKYKIHFSCASSLPSSMI